MSQQQDDPEKEIMVVQDKDVYTMEGFYFMKPKLLHELGKKNQMLEFIRHVTEN